MDTNEMNVMPGLGEKAPSFRANSTQGEIHFPSDYKGRWKILFSHPADFTPVCTSEFIAFAKMQQQFDDLNCTLVGISVDGINSHIAWLRTIRDKIDYKGSKGLEVKFPLVDDVSMKVAKLYGMIQPNVSTTAAVRAVFFIDKEDVIRTIIYYPLQLGRNFDEIKRVLIGLQTIDEFKVSLPADWRPGDDVIAPPCPNCEEGSHAETGVHCYDWFFCTKPLPKSIVEEKICV